MLLERIAFRGHPMVLALHPTTIEITVDTHLTRRGDCIVGVAAEKGCAGLGSETKQALCGPDSRVSMSIVVGDQRFCLEGRGDPRLTLTHQHDIVIRRSDFVSDRTLAVRASAAARDIPRGMVQILKDPETVGCLEIEVERLD
ncbi:MAG: DUF371 domain-containing protein [Nitrososphaerota archaeon]|nr:DUF371 domain-containing protein [Nitrososphaerota archaeon]